ncbi:hypothetical protein PF011_g3198 [Phytophthora fragariae]|uniref:Chromo domain-containing protein n=1 Tax=Phytophthora fragariae TaxID=53985 RepID=A0A6A3LYZ6_9STRA|nr:hypothetical protein PF011_g3198 [Phytophthora fragariae]
MTPQNAHQRHVAQFSSRDGRFLRIGGPNAPEPRVVATAGADGSDNDSDDGNFIVRGGLDNAPAVPAADAFVVSRLWTKRRINQKSFYLVQWEGYEDLTWEPTAKLPWELVAWFEATNRDSVWGFQSTRGRRRRHRSERPTRRSTHVRVRNALVDQLS